MPVPELVGGTGASAGAINALISALAWCIERDDASALDANLFHDTWIPIGLESLLPMHGALRRIRCLACGEARAWLDDLSTATPCPACHRPGGLRPDVVWFGEIPKGLERIDDAMAGCRLFLSIGTSGQVYPAAGFVAALRGRARRIELNLEPSLGSHLFEEARQGPATTLVPALVDELLAQWC